MHVKDFDENVELFGINVDLVDRFNKIAIKIIDEDLLSRYGTNYRYDVACEFACQGYVLIHATEREFEDNHLWNNLTLALNHIVIENDDDIEIPVIACNLSQYPMSYKIRKIVQPQTIYIDKQSNKLIAANDQRYKELWCALWRHRFTEVCDRFWESNDGGKIVVKKDGTNDYFHFA